MFKDKRLIPIFIVVFIDLLGFSLILPLLPYYASTVGASPQTIGYLVASYSLCQFLAAPFLGAWSDRYGRRPLLLYSQMGSLLGFILLALAPNLPNALLWLFVSRIIDGISGGNLTIAQAYISDISAPQERARNFGMIIGVSFGLGFLLGPTFGGFLSRWGYSVPALAAALLAFSSILATYFLLPETQHQGDEQRVTGVRAYTRVLEYLNLTAVRQLLWVFLFNALPFSLYVTMFALFAKTQLAFTAEQTGYYLGFVGLLGIIWQASAIGPLTKRVGDHKTLLIGLALSAAGLFAVAFVDVWWKLGFVALLFSLGHGLARPSLTSLITQAAPPNRRGGVLGAATSLESFSRIIAPILGGWIIAVHPTWLGWLGGLLYSVAVAIAFTVTVTPNE
ncbi:MAG: MFS transporter [Acidobacteria bacterium]|nr:MFS transporter [Acidobacteriota bacterium]MBI3428266.1 MFS transporter [Acidobacteriota bacterium]